MAKVDYGAVALIPVGEYSASRQYHANELVGYQGSSYIALQNPPVGTLPTNTTYFMLHTEGTSIATASTPGTVKPDGTSTVVDANGAMSVKLSILQTIQDTSSKIGNVPTGKTLQAQIDGLEPRVSSSEQALTVNLLNLTLASQAKNGITVTRNADNSYTFDGVFTGANDTTFVLEEISAIGFKDGTKYKLIGVPNADPRIDVFIGSVFRSTSREGVIATPPFTGTKVYIKVFTGADFTEPVTIKPMITTNLSATYDDYVPYSGSSGKLDTDYKILSEKIGNVGNTDLQSQLNAATQSIAQNTTDIAANAAGIAALNTGLTNTYKYAHDSNSIAYSSDGVGIIGAKVGRIVCITIYWANKVVPNGTLLYTLPSGQRPIVSIYARNGFDNQHGHISISSNGQVVYVSNQGDADYFHTSVAYVADS